MKMKVDLNTELMRDDGFDEEVGPLYYITFDCPNCETSITRKQEKCNKCEMELEW